MEHIATFPLADCGVSTLRSGLPGEVPLDEAHGIWLTVPTPPAVRQCHYCLIFPGAPPDLAPNRPRQPMTGTGWHDLTLDGIIEPNEFYPMRFRIRDGMLLFLPGSWLHPSVEQNPPPEFHPPLPDISGPLAPVMELARLPRLPR